MNAGSLKEYKKNIAGKIGMSTACFYPADLEKTFKTIVSTLGFKYTEIFVNTASETKIGYLSEIKKIADGEGAAVESIHPYFSGYESTLFFSDYKRRIYDSIDLYRQFMESAAYLGAKYIIFHGLLKNGIQKYPADLYMENFSLLNIEAKKYGVEVLQENVATTYAATPDYIRKLKKYGRLNFTFDLKHALLSNTSELPILKAMGANLKHVHLNDMNIPLNLEQPRERSMCRLPFAGTLSYDSLFSHLHRINYIGSLIIEVYRNNFTDLEEILDCKSTLLAYLSEA